jgi:hypothetical protein
MDTALFTFCAISLAASSGCAAYLFAYQSQRRTDQKARDHLRSELTELLKKFTDEHNKLVLQVSDMHDRFGVLDMKISGVAGRPHQAARTF